MQFSAEAVGIEEAVRGATTIDLSGGVRLRVAKVEDLIVLKLAAASEARRRPSKREHDIADVLALLEEHPEARTPEVAGKLRQVRAQIAEAEIE